MNDVNSWYRERPSRFPLLPDDETNGSQRFHHVWIHLEDDDKVKPRCSFDEGLRSIPILASSY